MACVAREDLQRSRGTMQRRVQELEVLEAATSDGPNTLHDRITLIWSALRS
jgi:hypothetical protein